jgi:L-amino acid N-acyltransferase YncA
VPPGSGDGAQQAAADRDHAPAVRDATEQDWPSIWPFFGKIVRAGESFGYDADMSEAEARDLWLSGSPSRTTVAISSAGEIVGSAHMHANRGGPGAHVASATFVVDPQHQGRGAGRGLLVDALSWARRLQFRAMQFNAVVATNRPALALYRSLGFEIVGTVPEAFHHPRHGYVDLHVMHTRL